MPLPPLKKDSFFLYSRSRIFIKHIHNAENNYNFVFSNYRYVFYNLLLFTHVMNDRLFFQGSFFVQVVTYTYLLSTACLWAGWGVNMVIFPIAIIIAGVINFRQEGYKTGISALLLLAVSLWVSTLVYDHSYDGQCYHIGTAVQLAEGWNPFYEKSTSMFPEMDIWIQHYAKGMETVSACIISTVGYWETGKAINLLLLLSTFFYTLWALDTFLPNNTSNVMRIGLVLIIVLNPVVVAQLMTLYIDYVLYSVLLILFILMYASASGEKCIRKHSLLNTTLLLFWVPGIKFNIVFWVALFMLDYVAVCYYKERKWERRFNIFIASGTLGLFVGAFNPYVTNAIDKGNPFYPLVGKGKIDIMTDQKPKLYQEKSDFEGVLWSLVANSDNDRSSTKINVVNISKQNIKATTVADARIGGFGLFFFEASFVLLIAFYLIKMPGKRYVWLGLLALFVSLFLLPSGWWARYVCYFYAFPLLMMVCIQKWGMKEKKVRALQYVALCMLTLNSLVPSAATAVYLITNNLSVDNIIHTLSNENHVYNLKTTNYNFLNKLDKKGVRYEKVDKEYSDTLPISGPRIFLDLKDYGFEMQKKYGVCYLQKKKD